MATESDLIERINKLADEAMKEGWSLTKQAMSAAGDLQARLTIDAERAYKHVLSQMALCYIVDSPSKEYLDKISLEVISVNINVFDLYRRVGRLEEARELGEETLKNAIETRNSKVILRAGNFLTLVQSAESYELMRKKNYFGAISKYWEIAKTFGSMPLNEAEGKNAVMLYGNQAGNYLNIVHASGLLGIKKLNIELDLAYDAAIKAERFIKSIDEPVDKAIWTANSEHVFGNIEEYRDHLDNAIRHYENALKASQEGSEYSLLIAVCQVSLAHAFISKPEKELKKAEQYFAPVEEFLQGNDFGIYNFHYEPMVKKIRDALKD
jgi:hypothetical protein